MLPYYLILLSVLCLGIVEQLLKDRANKILIRCVLLIILIITISGAISRGDYNSYIKIYNNINLENPNPVFEIAFYWMMVALKSCSFDPFSVFFAASSITILIKFYTLYKLKQKRIYNINYGYYFFLYFASFIVYQELGSIRFAVACSFFFLATIYLNNKKFLKYYCFIGIGFLFHNSLIVAVVLPFFLNRNIFLFLFISIFVGLLLIFNIENPTFLELAAQSHYFSKVINYTRFGTISVSYQLIKKILLLVIFYILYKKEIIEKQSYAYICWITSIFSFSIYFIFIISQLTASRYLLMFGICEPIMIIMIFNKLTKNLKILSVFVISIYVVISYKHGLSSNNNIINLYLPYKNYFMGDTQLYKDVDELKKIIEGIK
ncbi:EpsG family protein [Xenorhabdus bovienii]|uniref:EpsG family protein n=1 Tax=Xenorhabdus bovienii TaxID=40576 RepID=UPI0023B2461E|nr:EpsG family protein [Xenorhabdus bovienii]MDE9428668.1 EpsG family protein [Xenorhabdus bovienii]